MESIPLNWKPLEILHDSVEQCMAGTNWQALCSRASHLNHNEPCVMLKLMTTGLNHLIRLLRFSSSKTIWVVKIPIKQTVDKGPDRGLQAEVDVMCLLHERTSIGVPRILDYELTTENTAGVAFMLMEFLPGNAAMDTFGGWESHHGTIPPEYRHGFYSSIAKRQVDLASVRFPKIGIITRNSQGDYDVRPFPHLGGPFETATAFLLAWTRNTTFPATSFDLLDEVEQGKDRELVKEIRAAILDFPGRLATMVDTGQIPLKAGPFPVCHADLMHSNIIVDKDYAVLGIIDWEGASTLPWELVEHPLFLSTLPRAFSAPDSYDEKGKPLDPETKQCWQDREAYVEMVRLQEDTDHQLSECLSDAIHQGLAYTIREFKHGKLGLYGRVLDQYLL